MSEATTLYVMTAVVVAGLLVWVAVVLATAKTPWARGPLAVTASPAPALPEPAEPVVDAMTTGAHTPLPNVAPEVDADDTARATPVALSEGRAKAIRAAASSKPDEG